MRLPATTLARYRIADTVVMEERSDGILLRPVRAGVPKLSWEETAQEMASQAEDWSAWESTLGDGLDEIPWKTGAAAERGPKYSPRPRRKK